MGRTALYDRFDPNRAPLAQARALFLDVYARERSSVLSELESLLPLVVGLRKDPHLAAYFMPPDGWGLSEHIPELVDLRKHLSDWAMRFAFTIESPAGLVPVAWIMDSALSTLGRWADSSKHTQWVHPDLLFQHSYLDDRIASSFELYGRRLGETASQFKKRVLREGRLMAERRLLDEHGQGERDSRRASWAKRRTEINPKSIERLAKWQANPDLVLKEIDWRAVSKKGMGNASNDLTRAAVYIGITRRPSLTARRGPEVRSSHRKRS